MAQWAAASLQGGVRKEEGEDERVEGNKGSLFFMESWQAWTLDLQPFGRVQLCIRASWVVWLKTWML